MSISQNWNFHKWTEVCVWGSLGGGRGVDMQQASIGQGPRLGVGHLGQGLSHLLFPPHHICLPLQPVYALQQLCLLHTTSCLDTAHVCQAKGVVRGWGGGEGGRGAFSSHMLT